METSVIRDTPNLSRQIRFHDSDGKIWFEEQRVLLLQLALGAMGLKRTQPYEQRDAGLVDLTPWKPAPFIGGLLVTFALSIYIYFSS